MKTAIITTTIHVPKLLADYAADAVKHNRDVAFFVVSDKKTPPEAETFCKGVAGDSGLPVRWLGISQQEEVMAAFPELNAYIPWNCIQRRNVGHLLAWMEGYEMLIAIDDDNFVSDADYVGHHQSAFAAKQTESVSAARGWFNCCSLLEDAGGRIFFPRGYPVEERSGAAGDLRYLKNSARLVVNAGLWLGDPDVDAVTRLAVPPDVVNFPRGKTLGLAQGTWCPFNSQNTAVHRDVLPAWFLSPAMGRFDDIWASYVVLACSEKMGDAVAFGRPLVRQDRNAHDLFRDFDLERLGMRFSTPFCSALRAAQLSGKDYAACAMQALDAVANWLERERTLDHESRLSLEKFVQGYRLWIAAFQRR